MNTKIRVLADGLNEDLAHELSAIQQYIYNAAVVSGIARLHLKDYFLKEVKEEIQHAQYLAEKIAHLGAEPIVQSKPITPRRDVKKMLEVTKQAGIETIERYKKRIHQAEEAGQIEVKIQLENIIADETRHKEEIERILQDPSF